MFRKCEPLDWADRWFFDCIVTSHKPHFSIFCEIDITTVMRKLDELKHRDAPSNVKITVTHVVVWALGQIMREHADLNVMLKGYQRYYLDGLNIGISVAGQSFVAPVMVINNVENMSLEAIAKEFHVRVPRVKQDEMRLLRLLRTFGWLVPFGLLRRGILTLLFRSIWFRQKTSGTFQVTSVPTVDMITPYLTNSSAIFAIGQVQKKTGTNAHDADTRWKVHVTFTANHCIFDGSRGSRLLNALKEFLEHPESGLTHL